MNKMIRIEWKSTLMRILIAAFVSLFALAFTCGDSSDEVLNLGEESIPSDDDTMTDDDTDTDVGIDIAELLVCDIEGVRYRNREKHPGNVCLICDAKKSKDQWTENNAAPCDDGLFCNGRDLCYYGECYLHEGDPCAPRDCDEDADECMDSRR